MERRMYRYTTLVLCVAITVGARAPLAAGGGRADVATLRKIASRVDGRAGVISIEASDPMPYVASQPDPRHFVIELRNVVALGFADDFTPDPRHPVAAMQVETGQAADGARLVRMRMTLAQPMRPRVRSSRNVTYVEADRLDRAVSTAGTISTAGPSSSIRDVRVARRGTVTAVTLHGTGRLAVSGVEESKEGPQRLLIDLPNATSALPGTTPIGAGAVDVVRIGLNANSPLVTRVVMDLNRKAPYRLETSPDGNDLTVIFDETPSPAPSASALQGPAPPLQVAVLQATASPPTPALTAQQPGAAAVLIAAMLSSGCGEFVRQKDPASFAQDPSD